MAKNKAVRVFSVAIGLFLLSGLLVAHHSEALLDKDNKTTVTGTVTKWSFANPHPTVFLDGDVKDSEGKAVNWYASGGGGVLDLRKAGWTNKTLVPGDRILVQGQQVKDGRPVMGLRKLYRCSGEEVRLGYDADDEKNKKFEPLSPERVREMCAKGIVQGVVKPELFASAERK
jgi:uncharacterized protein DUF6152